MNFGTYHIDIQLRLSDCESKTQLKMTSADDFCCIFLFNELLRGSFFMFVESGDISTNIECTVP